MSRVCGGDVSAASAFGRCEKGLLLQPAAPRGLNRHQGGIDARIRAVSHEEMVGEGSTPRDEYGPGLGSLQRHRATLGAISRICSYPDAYGRPVAWRQPFCAAEGGHGM